MPFASELHIGSSSYGLVLRVTARPYAQDDNTWTANLLTVEVEGRAVGLSGAFETTLGIEDLSRLRDDLSSLSASLDPTQVVAFDPIEHTVVLAFHLDALGHLRVRVKLSPYPWQLATLQYEIELDQTYLGPMIAELNQILAIHPAVGS